MDPLFVGILGVILLLVLMALGVHIGIALGTTGFLGLICIIGFDAAITMAMTSIYFKISTYSLIVIPLFVLMGLLGASGGLSKSLYDGMAVWTGKIKSGLGIATILGCAGFGAITGSSIVTSAVFGKVTAPEMRRHGYDKKIAYGLCAAGGSIGMLIPPSILAVVYGILSGLSVGKLLIAGIGPGVLLTGLFCLQLVILGRLRPDLIGSKGTGGSTWKEKVKTIPSFWPVMVTGLVIFGGLFGGVFNPTEAAAVATVLIFVILVFTKGKEAWLSLGAGLLDTAKTAAMIFLILAGACVFSRFLVISGISDKVVEIILDLNLSNLGLVVILGFFYLLMGIVIDSISMLAISIPFLQPIIDQTGIEPYYFAMVAITATQVGIVTPPLGLAAYTVKSVAEPDVTLEDIFSGSFYFLLALMVGLALVVLFPSVSNVLVSTFMGGGQ